MSWGKFTALFHRIARVCRDMHYYSQNEMNYQWIWEPVLPSSFLQALVPMHEDGNCFSVCLVGYLECCWTWGNVDIPVWGCKSASSPVLCRWGLICVPAQPFMWTCITLKAFHSITVISFTGVRNKFNCYCNIRFKIYAREKYACNLRKKKEWNVIWHGVMQSMHIQPSLLSLALVQGVNAFALCPGCRFGGKKAKLHILCREEL